MSSVQSALDLFDIPRIGQHAINTKTEKNKVERNNIIKQLSLACSTGDLSTVRRIFDAENRRTTSAETNDDSGVVVRTKWDDDTSPPLTMLEEDMPLPLSEERLNGYTALHSAVQNGHTDIVRFLIFEQHADVDAVIGDPFPAPGGLLEGNNFASKRRNITPLLLASEKGHLEIVRLLLSLENRLDTSTTSCYGHSALHYAVYGGHRDVMSLLLSTGKFDVSAQTVEGMNAFQIAVSAGNVETVRFLKAFVADSDIRHLTRSGLNALQRAAYSGYLDLVKYLVEELAFDPYPELARPLEEPNEISSESEHIQILPSTMTPLHLAAASGSTNIVTYLLSECKESKCHEDDVKTKVYSTKQQTPNQSLAWRRKLIVNARTMSGQTPLHKAAFGGHVEVVKMLLDIDGVDVNAKDNTGLSVLHAAASGGKHDVVSCLLSVKGIDVYTTDETDEDAAVKAAKNGYRKLASKITQRIYIDRRKDDLLKALFHQA